MTIVFSQFATNVEMESAFEVLAVAKRLIADGKDVIELEIGDSPFPPSPSAAPITKRAIDDGLCRYAPSAGTAELRQQAARYCNREYGFDISQQHVIVGPGAKNFEQLFCDAFVDPGDAVLVFTPHFPTYPANIRRRGGEVVYAPLRANREFRPDPSDVDRFIADHSNAKAIFINSPHNPTGGVATEDDLGQIADRIRGRGIFVFSDEPYDRMSWNRPHHSIAAMPGMLDQCIAAYSFSKSFGMSGYRLGFAVASPAVIDVLTRLTNAAISCVPPFIQLAGAAVLEHDLAYRDDCAQQFRDRLRQFTSRLDQIDGVSCPMPEGTFYAFADVRELCQRHGIDSQDLAMHLLRTADPDVGVACLGGECFGPAGQGFLRFSVAQPPDRLAMSAEFIESVVDRMGSRPPRPAS